MLPPLLRTGKKVGSPAFASLGSRSARLHTSATTLAPRTIAVLGGGISGLASAHRLAKRLPASQYRILLLEQSDRLGGWIHSERVALSHATPPSTQIHPAPLHSTGPATALIEKGPRGIRPTGPTGMVMLELLRSLNLLERMLKVPKTAPSAQNRYIYYPDRLAKLPSSLASLLTALFKLPFLRAAIAKALLEFRIPSRFARPASESKAEQQRLRARESLEDESVDSFVSRRFGAGLAANLVSAVIHGIYAGDSRKLSVRSVMPFLWEAERTHASVLKSLFLSSKRNKRYRGLPDNEAAQKLRREEQAKQVEQRLGKELADSFKGISVYSFPNGLQEIVDALERDLDATSSVEVRKGTGVSSIVFGQDGKAVIRTAQGEEIPADRILSSLPSTKLAEALRPEELFGLQYNPSANVGVVNIVISPAAQGEASSSKPLLPVEGFGYLIPRTTPNNEDGILGVVFDSDSLPTQDLDHPLQQADANQLTQRPTKLTVMMGGAHWSHLDPASLPSESEMCDRAIRAVSKHLSIPASLLQDTNRTKILPTLQRDCIPQYLVGHPVRMEALHRALAQHPILSDKLSLVGASYTGVSLNDCVAYSIETADRVVDAELNHGSAGGGKAVTGLENFAHASPEPSRQSAESIGESIAQTPALSGAMQRMVGHGQRWLQRQHSGAFASGPLASSTPSRAIHTSATRRNRSAPLSPLVGTSASPTPASTVVGTSKKPRPLGEVLVESIRASGPMPVSTYMRTCLLDPVQGYYSSANAQPTSENEASREVLGSRGDFITSPEISQVFGELVGVFYVARWQACGEPKETRLVELGPGKGTLLADMLRTFSVFPTFLNALKTIHLVETSEGLMQHQLSAIRETLSKVGKKLAPADQTELGTDEIRIEWFPTVADVPLTPSSWTMLTAHEFFDALPTHVFEKTVHGFREVLVGIRGKEVGQSGITVLKPSDLVKPASTTVATDRHRAEEAAEKEKREKARQDELQFVLSPGPTPWSKLLAEGNKRYATIQPGQRIEVSPEAWAAARRVGELVAGRPSAAPPRTFSPASTGGDLAAPSAEELAAETDRLTPPSEGGVALIIDYGDDKTFGSSLRAFRQHEIVDVFHQPGRSDLTVNVDFVHLKSALASTEAGYHGPMDQAHFLVAMGLQQRVEKLRREARDEQRRGEIERAANRLVDLAGMGKQYKVLAVKAARSGGTVRRETGKLALRTEQDTKLYPFEM